MYNVCGFNPVTDAVPTADLLQLDRWIIGRTSELQQDIIAAYENYQLHLIYQKLHNFCVVELGGFYLDIIKDRQYTTKANSLARRSAQTAMQHVIEAMVRWIAPILSFTADEMWPVIAGDRSQSVFVAEWYKLPAESSEAFGNEYWELVAQVKNAVNKVLEVKRGAGEVGGSLGTEVVLFCDATLQQQLQKLGNELRFVLITSTAEVRALADAQEAVATDVNGLKVSVKKSIHPKCTRCWHHRADVGRFAMHPELCARCVENVDGQGELRKFA